MLILCSLLVLTSLPCPYILNGDSLSLVEIEGGSLCGAKRVWPIYGLCQDRIVVSWGTSLVTQKPIFFLIQKIIYRV